MAEYVVTWLEDIQTTLASDFSMVNSEKIRHYQVFNLDGSIENREKATKLYEELKLNKSVISVILTKIIESESYPERLKN